MTVQAILVHGLGRTPLSMRGLARHLRKASIQPHLFGYWAAFENFDDCRNRLKNFIATRCESAPFIVIGHSLGSVLLRSVLPELRRPPQACFLLAPPTVACRAARFFGPRYLFKFAAGEMGQLLGNDAFMASLPVPAVHTVIYAGTAGPRRQWWPLKDEENDGILLSSESMLPNCQIVRVPSLHTFIMNSSQVRQHMFSTLGLLPNSEK